MVRNCQSRIDTSFRTVKPAIASRASCPEARLTRRPITNPSSTSQSIWSDSGGSTIGSRGPISELAYFANRVGCDGASRPISSMWLL